MRRRAVVVDFQAAAAWVIVTLTVNVTLTVTNIVG